MNMGRNSNLPEDIIRDILLRLPVQTLLRFKAVSKLWLAFITKSNFIDTHCQHPPNPKLSVMLTNRDFFSISVLPAGRTCRVDDRNMRFSTDMDECLAATIVGSSNGLLCLHVHKRYNRMCYKLWNPETRQYRELPPNKGAYYSRDQGFGHHHGIKDYKLVQLVKDLNSKLEAEVFSLSTDSWRKVEASVPSCDYRLSKPDVVKGVYYHMVLKSQETPFIIRFDMGDDTVSNTKAPPLRYNYEDIDCIDRVELMVYKDLPSICRYDYKHGILFNMLDFQFDMRAMKSESWTKVLTCCGNSLPDMINGGMPLGIWVDEESLILEYYELSPKDYKWRNGLFLFNLSTQEWKILVVDEANRFGRAHSYVESMVSVYTTKHQD